MSELPETLQERWTKAWDACVNNKQKKEVLEEVISKFNEKIIGDWWTPPKPDENEYVEKVTQYHKNVETIKAYQEMKKLLDAELQKCYPGDDVHHFINFEIRDEVLVQLHSTSGIIFFSGVISGEHTSRENLKYYKILPDGVVIDPMHPWVVDNIIEQPGDSILCSKTSISYRKKEEGDEEKKAAWPEVFKNLQLEQRKIKEKQKKEKREKIALMTSEFVHGQKIEWKEINYDHYGRVESTISCHGKIERINERNEDVPIFDVLNDDRTMTKLEYGTFWCA
jgi:hypothetical protein